MKIVKLKNVDPPNLKGDFVGYDTTNLQEYRYKAPGDDLRLWVRFSDTIEEKSEYSDVPVLVYGNKDVSESNVFGKVFNVANFADGIDSFVTGTYSDTTNPIDTGITFTDGSGTDLPFSVSFWINRNIDAGGYDYLFTKGHTDNIEYRALYRDAGAPYLELTLNDNSITESGTTTTLRAKASGCELAQGTWHHVVFTYDGNGVTDKDTSGIKIYVDGVSKTITDTSQNASNYGGMEKVSNVLDIGHQNKLNRIEGRMAEFAIFAKALSQSEIKAIYYNTYDRYKVNSGYLNMPPRIRLRDIDNLGGKRPTVHRSGDKDRSGKFNIKFDDQDTLFFGKVIKDAFEHSGVATDTLLNSQKWQKSLGLVIRQEKSAGPGGVVLRRRAVVFNGRGTRGERFIRTAEKVRNPYVVFDLIQGPYSVGNDPFQHLNLKQGNIGAAAETLNVQISTTGSSWITIATYTPDSSQLGFFDGQDNPGYELAERGLPVKRIILDQSNFPDQGEPFYIRFVQTVFAEPFKAVWAISYIQIESINQTLRAPTLINDAHTAGQRAQNKAIVTPHTRSHLEIVGRALKGVSDSFIYYQKNEDITPFNETNAIEDYGTVFYSQGTPNSVYPGFENPAQDKSKFSIELNTSAETILGYTSSLSDANVEDDTSGKTQALMAYWNNGAKKWQKVSSPNGQLGVHAMNVSTKTVAAFNNMANNAAVGFSPIGRIFTGSAENLRIQHRDVLSLYGRPTDAFAFPHAAPFLATGSLFLRPEDFGITKPFLLEKAVIEFPLRVQTPAHAGGTTDNVVAKVGADSHAAFAHTAIAEDAGSTDTGFNVVENLNLRMPTFFMLRQFENASPIHHDVLYQRTIADGSQVFISSSVTIDPDVTINDSVIKKTRELITYGQMLLVYSGTSKFTTQPDIDEILEGGLSRDLNVINPGTGSFFFGHGAKMTGSFKMEFPCRIPVNNHGASSFQIKFGNVDTNNTNFSNEICNVMCGNNMTGRGHKRIEGAGRSVGNAMVGRGKTKEYNILNCDNLENDLRVPLPDSQEIDKISPYLLIPGDEIILGWQYPLITNLFKTAPNSNDGLAANNPHNSMTLHGNTKLTLYGSLIKNNREIHEHVNQNLSSDALFEHIGAETILDEFQVQLRHEFTGSTLDLYNANMNSYPSDPTARIGMVFVGVSDTSGINDGSLARFFSLRDQTRVYNDSFYATSGEVLATDDSSLQQSDSETSYGLFNVQSRQTHDATFQVTSQRPKYNFNYKHYGYLSDMIKQGLDGKYVDTLRSQELQELVTIKSPVEVRFVGKETVPVLGTAYKKIKVSELLEDPNSQSSNVDLFATSSIPYFDTDENGDAKPEPRNRTYQSADLVAFPDT